MKKFLIWMFTCLLLLSLVACDDEPGETSGNDYPAGAIALTKDNFKNFFDIHVSTDFYYDYDVEFTKATSYVALVPKGDYGNGKIEGEISFELNATLKQVMGGSTHRVSTKVEKIAFQKGVMNQSFTSYAPNGHTTQTRYFLVEDSNNITIKDVSGYLTIGSSAPTEYEQIKVNVTESDSQAALTELRALVEAFQKGFDVAKSYHFAQGVSYHFGSYYGENRDVTWNAPDKVSIDLVNQTFLYGGARYYYIDNVCFAQRLQANDVVTTERSGMTIEEAQDHAQPLWEIFDANALYSKVHDGYYVAYIPLSQMKAGECKDEILSDLREYGITTRHDEFIVKYEYGFDGSSFLFSATIDHLDYTYPVEFVDIEISYEQKISDVDNASVTLYSPDQYQFEIPDNLEDAMALQIGYVEIGCDTKEFTYHTYSDQYKGYNSTNVENFFPMYITEGGVYQFTPSSKTIAIYDANGNYCEDNYAKGNYYPAGLYYVRCNSVLYGYLTHTMTVSGMAFVDYGDVNHPTVIGDDGVFSCYFEGNEDRCVLSFTPSATGIYSFGDHGHVAMYAYEIDSFDSPVATTSGGTHNLSLEEGVTYILVLDAAYGAEEPFTFSGTVMQLGTPTENGFVITGEMQDVFLWGENDPYGIVNITTPGAYYIAYEYGSGQELTSSAFYTLDGKYIRVGDYVETENGTLAIVYLDVGTYHCKPDVYSNSYYMGGIALVAYQLGEQEEKTVTLSTSQYTTITTENLATLYSSSTLTFEVEQDVRLLCTTDSDFFTIYDEAGNRVSITSYPTYRDVAYENVEVKYSANLSPGTYTIVFVIDEYTKPGVKEAAIRLQPLEEL